MHDIRRILVPTDFSDCSTHAVDRGTCLAEKEHAELHLLHVHAPVLGIVSHEEPHDERSRRARHRLNQLLPPHAELRLSVHREVLEGTPADVIHDYATQHDIDLIVMGTHGRTGLAHVVLGSVAEKVLRCSPCPVVVCRPAVGDGQLPLREAAEVLQNHFGDTLSGDRHQTRAQMKGRVARELEVSDALAIRLIEQLESQQVLSWTEPAEPRTAEDQVPGGWQISPDRLQVDRSQLQASGRNGDSGTSPALDLVRRALAVRATDVHIDPTVDGDYSVRFRIDGRLESYCQLDFDVAEHLTHQLRMLANLEIVDRFRPQEGRLRLPGSLSSDLEVRVTTSPVTGGDATALRLFSRENVFLPLSSLGFDPDALAAIEEMLHRGEGIMLVTGPTGTGKSTTVYSMLEFLGTEQRNIVSIEDPVEFAAPFVRQMSVDEDHGVTMTNGLRTMLRMDPDIIFLGEIRDAEAAEISMRAAASGRHVLSTLHTRDVAATVTALRDLNVDRRSLAANLRGIINQRLLRRLCPHCGDVQPITAEQRETFLARELEAPAELITAVGCDECRGTGYHGRTGVFEVAVIADDFAAAISDGAAEDELRGLLRSRGTHCLTVEALKRVRDGVTSFAEAIEMHWI